MIACPNCKCVLIGVLLPIVSLCPNPDMAVPLQTTQTLHRCCVSLPAESLSGWRVCKLSLCVGALRGRRRLIVGCVASGLPRSIAQCLRGGWRCWLPRRPAAMLHDEWADEDAAAAAAAAAALQLPLRLPLRLRPPLPASVKANDMAIRSEPSTWTKQRRATADSSLGAE